MNLPHAKAADVSREKIVDYLLNPLHPDGSSKAKFFASLGFSAAEWPVFADALRRMARDVPVAKRVDSPHGRKYILDGPLDTPGGRSVAVRTVWIIDRGREAPRLVTVYPRGEGG